MRSPLPYRSRLYPLGLEMTPITSESPLETERVGAGVVLVSGELGSVWGPKTQIFLVKQHARTHESTRRGRCDVSGERYLGIRAGR